MPKEHKRADLDQYIRWIKSKLLIIDPSLNEVFPDNKLTEYIKQIVKEDSSSQFNNGYQEY